MSADDDSDEMKKIGRCIRNVANMSHVKSTMLMDTNVFNPRLLKLVIPKSSPKLAKLFDHIAELDAKDMKKENKLFKHMIFTDLASSSYGVKLIASAFVANEFTPAFTESLGLKTDPTLLKTKGKNFGVLISKTWGKKSMSVKSKKAQMLKYNERPTNVHGDLMRFIILDQGFKEGIDLFDVKYVHLFEPLVSLADQKQAIGRGTRFCGQKGLEFHPRHGWPLHVFKYDVKHEQNTMHELFLEHSDIDIKRVVFAAQLEEAVIDAAVDKTLTTEIHTFKIENMSASGGVISKHLMPPRSKLGMVAMQNYVTNNFGTLKYPKVKLENKCLDVSGGRGKAIEFTPTQEFVRHFFQPASAYKGMLLFHGVGTGKTCCAIATASTSFEREGYTILWVTRHTLKSDIWKNMYDQVCSIDILTRLDQKKLVLPKGNPMPNPKKYVSEQWIEPVSYKQFSNMLLKKNKFYEEIVNRNGQRDPLRKTLIIIDEAHKLYAENVVGSEKPKTEILEAMIQNSYKVSGKNSCRVLLMTATPYTSDGMELIKLLNLLREKPEQWNTNFQQFGKTYLDREGKFTKSGLSKFKNEVSGYVSYVNRSQDARNFAHPILKDILVPMTTSLDQQNAPTKHIDNELKDVVAQIKQLREDIRLEKAALQGKKGAEKGLIEACKVQAKEVYNKGVNAAKVEKEKEMACIDAPNKTKCKQAANAVYKDKVEKLKIVLASTIERCKYRTSSAKRLASKIAELNDLISKNKGEKEDKRGLLKSFAANSKEISQEIRELKKVAAGHKAIVKDLTQTMLELRQKAKKSSPSKKASLKLDIKKLNKKIKEAKEPLYEVKEQITTLNTEKRMDRIEIGRGKLGDLSQETALQKCLS